MSRVYLQHTPTMQISRLRRYSMSQVAREMIAVGSVPFRTSERRGSSWQTCEYGSVLTWKVIAGLGGEEGCRNRLSVQSCVEGSSSIRRHRLKQRSTHNDSKPGPPTELLNRLRASSALKLAGKSTRVVIQASGPRPGQGLVRVYDDCIPRAILRRVSGRVARLFSCDRAACLQWKRSAWAREGKEETSIYTVHAYLRERFREDMNGFAAIVDGI
ncbi:hypothetical protein C8Q80DRAFT_1187996 [Daedaleopsis nitida]|nr:hypothetical protein C8Q80DRAFT_1187996 [Daedaleopsis nitida]